MPLDGVLQLDDVEEHLVHESFTVDTRDHEDHSFCGVMFNVECWTILPAEYIEIQALSVRGQLGPMTVWYTPDDFQGKQECEDAWEKIYEGTHAPSQNTYTELRLPTPVRLRPGQRCGLYVHSALPGDEGIVYDNQRKAVTYQDRCFRVLPGFAHLSCRPFGKRGFWGRPWRSSREFVGKISYGVLWKMWQPNQVHRSFPLGFQDAVKTMIMASRRPESLMYLLQDEIIFFIMNKCSWNWWGEEMSMASHLASQQGTLESSDDDDEDAWSSHRRRLGSFGIQRGFQSASGLGGFTSSSLFESLLGESSMHHAVNESDSTDEDEDVGDEDAEGQSGEEYSEKDDTEDEDERNHGIDGSGEPRHDEDECDNNTIN